VCGLISCCGAVVSTIVLMSKPKSSVQFLCVAIHILLIISNNPLSKFNHGLGLVESIRSLSVFSPRICAILGICQDSVWTQLRHGLPFKQDIHQKLDHAKSLSSMLK
jgi:hypothetical protein